MRIPTFDLEEWFHSLGHPKTRNEKQWQGFESQFEINLEHALDIKAEHNVNGTVLCLGWIAETYPQLIAKIVERDIEIACHSSRHQLAYNQIPTKFGADVLKAKDQFSSISGVEVNAYRILGFSLFFKIVDL